MKRSFRDKRKLCCCPALSSEPGLILLTFAHSPVVRGDSVVEVLAMIGYLGVAQPATWDLQPGTCDFSLKFRSGSLLLDQITPAKMYLVEAVV